jgi:hypothetical protein
MDILRLFAICCLVAFTALPLQTRAADAAINPELDQRIAAAMELAVQNRFDEAIATLDKARTELKLNELEHSHLLIAYGILYNRQGKPGKAQKSVEEALKYKKLPIRYKAIAHKVLGSAYKAQQKNKDALTYFQLSLSESEKPDPQTLALMGETEYDSQHYENAFSYLDRAIAAVSKERVPEEGWLLLFRNTTAKLNRKYEYYDSLRQLALFYPKEQYLKSLRDYSRGREPASEPATRKKNRDETFRKGIFEILDNTQKQTKAGDYATPRATLEGLLAKPDLTSYERVMTWNYLVNVYLKLDRVPLIVYSYEQVRGEEDASDKLLRIADSVLAHLYLGLGYSDRSLARAQEALKLEYGVKEAGDACEASYLTGKYEKTVKICDQLIAIAGNESKKIEEVWLQALAMAYQKLGMRKEETKTVKQLVKLYPDGGHQARLAELQAAK